MDKNEVYLLMEKSMDKVFAFAMARCAAREEAEDLSSDIMLAVMDSAEKIKDSSKFYAFLWAVARNIYARHVQKCISACKHEHTDEAYITVNTPETEYIKNEQSRLLRRELALLSGRNRDIITKFYLKNQSCEQIAMQLNITPELVRYTLHMTRKALQEGINMQREYGRRSFMPDVFSLEADFISHSGYDWWGIFKNRKLPGNILLTAYDAPLGISELSQKLGVASAYLEDELALLRNDGFITESAGRYRTNIVISTDSYEKKLIRMLIPIAEEVSGKLGSFFDTIDFSDITAHMSAAPVSETAVNEVIRIAISDGIGNVFSAMDIQDTLLAHGDKGMLIGHDTLRANNLYGPVNMFIFNKERDAFIHRLERECAEQAYQSKPVETNIDLICSIMKGEYGTEDDTALALLIERGFVQSDGGELSVTFPVYSEREMDRLHEKIVPAVELMNNYIQHAQRLAAKEIRSYTPTHLRRVSRYAAALTASSAAAGLVRDMMTERKYITAEQAYIVGVIHSAIMMKNRRKDEQQ